MVKRIQISADSGTTNYTLPGSKGELTNEAGTINDTIFGQDFSSTQSGLIGWAVNANGLYKGFAGYVAKIMKSGVSTAMVGEAMSVVAGKTYKITASTKNVLDRLVEVVVKDNAVVVEAEDIESVDYLFGRVTFAAGYTPTGPITMDAHYLPMTQVGGANGFTLTQTANATDNSTYETTQANEGHRTYEYGLRTVSLNLKGVYAISNAFVDLLRARAEMVIEINPDGSGKSAARGWFKPTSTGQSGDVGNLEEETLDLGLSVPDQEDISLPFSWMHSATTTLSMALRIALDSFESGELTHCKYLYNGTDGIEGEAIITDLSLTGGLEVMNEFTVKFQGSGLPENVS